MTKFTASQTRRTVLGGAAGLVAASALPAFAQDAELEAKGYALGDVVKGDPNAPVTIIEYASLTCPHCGSFHVNSYPQIKADYIETGKAKLILREVYFQGDNFGFWSSAVARCGGDDLFYPMIDQFLSEQQTWLLDHRSAAAQTGNNGPILAEIRRIGRTAGLSNERIDACLSDEPYWVHLAEKSHNASRKDGVRSTPTFFVNGDQITGAVSAETMAAAIEKHL